MALSPETSPATQTEDVGNFGCPRVGALDAFLRQQLPADAAEDFAGHLNQCRQCQQAAEERLAPTASSAEILWFPDQPERITAPASAPFPPEKRTAAGLIDQTQPVQSHVNFVELPGGSGRILAGRFELRRPIGMGGCGTVFEAWDSVLRRDVAVKVPHWSLFEKPSVRLRFAVEARAAARLSHANIVPVHEARIEDGETCFLVSELIRGPSLEAWLVLKRAQGEQVSIHQAVEIVADLAGALHCAHLAGVLHRDMKPSNVLLAPTPSGELPFTPRITDFGLARLSEEVTLTTVDGGGFGSLQYMAPEQATGRGQVGLKCDVYALGAILYELVTGELPVVAGSPPALLAAIPVQPVVPLRRRRRDVPADLDAICLKCLEKSPGLRYASAAALSEDLRRFLAGEVVTARLPHPGERVARWISRHPAAAVVATTMALAATVFVVVLAVANDQKTNLIGRLKDSQAELQGSNRQLKTALRSADEMRRQADQMRHLAERQQLVTQERLYVSDFRQAMRAWEDGGLASVERILNRLEGAAFSPFRGIECEWLRTKVTRPYRELTRMPGPIYTIAFSGNGQMLAAAGRDSVARIVNYADGKTLREWPTRQLEVNAVAFSPDSRRLWTTGDDGSLCQWDVATGKEIQRIAAHAPGKAFNLSMPKESDLLISVGSDGRACFWDSTTGQERGAMRVHDASVAAIDCDLAGRFLYTAGKDHKLRTWSIPHRQLINDVDLGTNFPITIIGRRNGSTAVVAESGPNVRYWHPSSNGFIEVRGFVDDVRVLAEHPTVPLIYAIDAGGGFYPMIPPPLKDYPRSGSVQMHDLTKPVARLHVGRVFAAELSPDRTGLVTCGEDGSVRFWSLEDLSPIYNSKKVVNHDLIKVLDQPVDSASILAVSEQAVLAIDVRDLSIQEAGPLPRGLKPRDARDVQLLPDGTLLWIEQDETHQSRLTRRVVATGETLQSLALGSVDDEPLEIAVDPRLGLLVVGDHRSPYCHIVSCGTFELLRPLRVRVPPKHIAISSDQSLLALSQDRRIEVYELTKRELIWSRRTSANILQLRFLDHENCFLSATADRVIRKWDTASGKLLSEMTGHRSQITSMQASRNGRTLFTSSKGGEIMLWHLPTGELLGHLAPVQSGVHRVVLSAGEDHLLIHDYRALLQSISLSY